MVACARWAGFPLVIGVGTLRSCRSRTRGTSSSCPAAANVVRHAYGPEESGAVELTLWTEEADDAGPATLSIEVVDHGQWRPPGERPTEGGRGIGLMSTMAESVLIRYDDRGSRVLLRHRIADPQ
jgi:serine/threonine-protein kinase RsbW